MRIPKGILQVGRICPDDDGKYSISSVHVKRIGETRGRVEATDGRSAIRCDFEEPASEILPGFGVTEESKEGFFTLVKANAAMEADKQLGKDKYLIVDEQAEQGTVRMVAPEETQVMFEGHVGDGKFPPIDDVLKPYEPVCEAAGVGQRCVRVGIGLRLLRDTLRAVIAATKCDDVVLEVPLQPNRPMRIVPGRTEIPVKFEALLMPLNLTDAAMLGSKPYGKVLDLSNVPEVPQPVQMVFESSDGATQPRSDEGPEDPALIAARELDRLDVFEIVYRRLGLKSQTAEALMSDGIRTGMDLQAWLREGRRVKGVSEEMRQKVGDAVGDWLIKRAAEIGNGAFAGVSIQVNDGPAVSIGGKSMVEAAEVVAEQIAEHGRVPAGDAPSEGADPVMRALAPFPGVDGAWQNEPAVQCLLNCPEEFDVYTKPIGMGDKFVYSVGCVVKGSGRKKRQIEPDRWYGSCDSQVAAALAGIEHIREFLDKCREENTGEFGGACSVLKRHTTRLREVLRARLNGPPAEAAPEPAEPPESPAEVTPAVRTAMNELLDSIDGRINLAGQTKNHDSRCAVLSLAIGTDESDCGAILDCKPPAGVTLSVKEISVWREKVDGLTKRRLAKHFEVEAAAV